MTPPSTHEKECIATRVCRSRGGTHRYEAAPGRRRAAPAAARGRLRSSRGSRNRSPGVRSSPTGTTGVPLIFGSPFDAATTRRLKTAVRDLRCARADLKPAGRQQAGERVPERRARGGPVPAKINARPVDACNVVVVSQRAADQPGRCRPARRCPCRTGALQIAVAPAGTTYVFNPSGQVIDASGLLRVPDAIGPTRARQVKDAQRTKTHDATRATPCRSCGARRALPGRTAGGDRASVPRGWSRRSRARASRTSRSR